MDFFDKVKDIANEAANTISDAAKDVSAGAKELSEKARIKRAIKTEEQKINFEYKTIGEKLYKANEMAPAGYEDSFKIIKTAEEEIKNLHDELTKIENSNKCPECGTKTVANQKFCQLCGKKLDE